MSHAGALAEAVLVMHFNIVWGGLSPFFLGGGVFGILSWILVLYTSGNYYLQKTCMKY